MIYNKKKMLITNILLGILGVVLIVVILIPLFDLALQFENGSFILSGCLPRTICG